jgi:hypothetical protein
MTSFFSSLLLINLEDGFPVGKGSAKKALQPHLGTEGIAPRTAPAAVAARAATTEYFNISS